MQRSHPPHLTGTCFPVASHEAQGSYPSTPSSDASPREQSNLRHPSSTMATFPVPPNSPSDDSSPKISTRLGQGWMSTFPATSVGYASPNSSPLQANFMPSATSHGTSVSHRSSTSPPRAVPMKIASGASNARFDPFADDDGDLLAAAVNRSLSDLATSPLSPTKASFHAPTGDHELSRSTSAERDANGVPVCTAEEIGEGRNVYLPSLNTTVTETQLRRIGQQFGRVVSIKIERSRDSFDMLSNPPCALPRTYAFIMFDSPLAAKSFMNKMHQQDIACQYGKETPHLKQKALEDPHSSNLYVAEIPLDASDDEMRSLFAPGIISSLRFLTDDHGNRRGTAMIRLQSRAQADEAIARLDNKWTMRGCSKKLQVRIADSEHQKQYKRTTMQASPDASESAMLQRLLAIQAELRRRELERQSTIDVSGLRSEPSQSTQSVTPCYRQACARWEDDKSVPISDVSSVTSSSSSLPERQFSFKSGHSHTGPWAAYNHSQRW